MLFLSFASFLNLREEVSISSLDAPTPRVAQIADKHGVPLATITAQLEKGIKVEREHTTDSDVAREIALDHIAELPDYYDRLAQMEEDVNPCWDGYEMVGMKTVDGQSVPNCVPMEEDAPANAAGGGHVAGLGIGPAGEPGVRLPKRRMDEATDTFAGSDVFDVDPGVVFKMRGAKLPWERYSKYVGEEPTGEAIRQHARKQWARNIILRDARTGVMTYLRQRSQK